MRWLLISTDPLPQRIRGLIKMLVLVGLLFALFWIVPVNRVIQALLTVDMPLFILGIGLGLLAVFLTSLQMKLLLHNQQIQRGVGQIFAVNLAVKFYLLFTPTTLIASGVRWYRFSRPEGKFTEAFVALASFRLLGSFLTLTMGLGFLLIGTQYALLFTTGWIILLIIGIIIIWLLFTRFSLPIYQWVNLRSGRLFNMPIFHWVSQRIEKLLEAASAYAQMPATGLLGIIVSVIFSFLTVIASAVVFAKSLGIDIGFIEMGWIQAVISLVSQLPFTMAEGLGVREVTLVTLLGLFGVGAERALALSFLIFIRGVVIALLGGIVEAISALRTKRLTAAAPIPREPSEN